MFDTLFALNVTHSLVLRRALSPDLLRVRCPMKRTLLTRFAEQALVSAILHFHQTCLLPKAQIRRKSGNSRN